MSPNGGNPNAAGGAAKTLADKRSGRPVFPQRAVVTAGMPYGSKDLFFHHVGGQMVHADVFARFLRNRIGRDNVLFVSGTDCYGSPAMEAYRKLCEDGGFEGTLEEFVRSKYEAHKEAAAAYELSFDLFAASAFDRPGEIHREVSAWILETLHKNGHLKPMTTSQFYDAERGVFLNGRQVAGRCPIAGCQSESAYADECSLGHQYLPTELIDPKSTLTGNTPEMRDVTNWYLKLDEFRPLLLQWAEEWARRPASRPFIAKSIGEFLEPPVIYLKRDFLGEAAALPLPRHEVEDDGKAPSVKLVFAALEDREAACGLLSGAGVNYRTGKTLVPFRLTGNAEWGVPAPALEGLDGLTFWVWPESLWAPISFVRAALEARGEDGGAWKRWWCGSGTRVYQFIGQDNIYFYGPAQAALFMGMQGPAPSAAPGEDDLVLTDILANNHILFLNKKASSSGKLKPPKALDMLEYYTAEQLRAHVFGLGLGLRSVSFQPKPLNPNANEKDADPVLKEGNLLTNVFNRVARSCFYTAQKYNEGRLPACPASREAMDTAEEAALDVEAAFARSEFHQVMSRMDEYIRFINKHWSRYTKEADAADDNALRMQVLADCFYMTRVAAVLMQPVAPSGCEMIAEYMNLGGEETGFFDWKNLFEPLSRWVPDPAAHRLKELEPRVDFFPKHERQLVFEA